MLVGQPHGLMMTTGQRFGFAMVAAAIDRTHGVDDMFDCQLSARGNDCMSGGQSSNFADDSTALREDRRASSVMNCAINSAATQ